MPIGASSRFQWSTNGSGRGKESSGEREIEIEIESRECSDGLAFRCMARMVVICHFDLAANRC